MKSLFAVPITLAALLSALHAAPPNILFIMTDQQSADAMSCRMGDRYLKTPAMDRLAARGTVFSRSYSPNPLCMPARNSIFTGRYPHETGITDNTKVNLDPTEFVSMGTYFQRAGYRTAYFGKWHLAYDEGATKPTVLLRSIRGTSTPRTPPKPPPSWPRNTPNPSCSLSASSTPTTSAKSPAAKS